jgi:hypothetical protein
LHVWTDELWLDCYNEWLEGVVVVSRAPGSELREPETVLDVEELGVEVAGEGE